MVRGAQVGRGLRDGPGKEERSPDTLLVVPVRNKRIRKQRQGGTNLLCRPFSETPPKEEKNESALRTRNTGGPGSSGRQ